jgi:hypothetical protein
MGYMQMLRHFILGTWISSDFGIHMGLDPILFGNGGMTVPVPVLVLHLFLKCLSHLPVYKLQKARVLILLYHGATTNSLSALLDEGASPLSLCFPMFERRRLEIFKKPLSTKVMANQIIGKTSIQCRA